MQNEFGKFLLPGLGLAVLIGGLAQFLIFASRINNIKIALGFSDGYQFAVAGLVMIFISFLFFSMDNLSDPKE
jgi:hypothetical protein